MSARTASARQNSRQKKPKRAPVTSSHLLATSDIVGKATLSLRSLSLRDALRIWKSLGQYLAACMVERRPVTLDQFGIFGLTGAMEPLLQHHAGFLQSNRIKETRPSGGTGALALSSTAMAKLNVRELVSRCLPQCNPDIVRLVLRHVIAYVGKMAKEAQQMQLSFLPMGYWICTGQEVRFEFLPEFRAQFGSSFRPSKVKQSSEEQRSLIAEIPETPEDNQLEHLRGDQSEPSPPEPKSLTRESLQAHIARFDRASSSSNAGQEWSIATADTGRPCQPLNQRLESSQRARHEKSSAQQGSAQGTGPSDSIVHRVKRRVCERCGLQGLNALSRILALMDSSGDGELSPKELKLGLRDLGIEVSKKELGELMAHFDRDRSGTVSVNELLEGLRDSKLSGQRLDLVNKAYRLMDEANRGFVTLQDLRENYDVSFFPDVRAGKKAKQQALQEFLQEWKGRDGPLQLQTTASKGNKSKAKSREREREQITYDAFLDYYQNVSACVDDDGDFQLLMRNAWHVQPDPQDLEPSVEHATPSGKSAPSDRPSHRDKQSSVEVREKSNQNESDSVRESAGVADTAQEIRLPEEAAILQRLLVSSKAESKAASLDEMCRLVGANRILGDGNEAMNTRAFAHALVQLDRSLSAKKSLELATWAASACGSDRHAVALVRLHEVLTCSSISSTRTSNGRNMNVVDRVRHRLLERMRATKGSAFVAHVGLNELQRTLSILDANRDRRLTKEELRIGLSKLGVDLALSDVDYLFSYFDTDHSGCISTDEFLTGMRGEMSPRRAALVDQAFAILDRNGDGAVTVDELADVYDVSKHPDVLSGKLTATQALRLFANQWEGQSSSSKDGMVTKQEFDLYYRNLSASIDLDDYFELMMRNVWHLSGGEGVCANSSNLRVLVTDADGNEAIKEVKNDIGLRRSDTVKIRAKLQAQSSVDGAAMIDSRGAAIDADPSRDRGVGSRDGQRSGSRRRPQVGPRPKQHAVRRAQGVDNKHTTNASVRDLFTAGSSRAGAMTRAERASELQRTREVRRKAAELLQAAFRGHRARKFVDCVRRKMQAEAVRKEAMMMEQSSVKKRVLRPALKTYHGF